MPVKKYADPRWNRSEAPVWDLPRKQAQLRSSGQKGQHSKVKSENAMETMPKGSFEIESAL
jgi:hypothetical protein